MWAGRGLVSAEEELFCFGVIYFVVTGWRRCGFYPIWGMGGVGKAVASHLCLRMLEGREAPSEGAAEATGENNRATGHLCCVCARRRPPLFLWRSCAVPPCISYYRIKQNVAPEDVASRAART